MSMHAARPRLKRFKRNIRKRSEPHSFFPRLNLGAPLPRRVRRCGSPLRRDRRRELTITHREGRPRGQTRRKRIDAAPAPIRQPAASTTGCRVSTSPGLMVGRVAHGGSSCRSRLRQHRRCAATRLCAADIVTVPHRHHYPFGQCRAPAARCGLRGADEGRSSPFMGVYPCRRREAGFRPNCAFVDCRTFRMCGIGDNSVSASAAHGARRRCGGRGSSAHWYRRRSAMPFAAVEAATPIRPGATACRRFATATSCGRLPVA